MHPSQIYGEPVTVKTMAYVITLPPKTFHGHKVTIGPNELKSIVNDRWTIPAGERATFEHRHGFFVLHYWRLVEREGV